MAGPYVEFITTERRAVMEFLFLRGKTTIEIYDDMSVTSGAKSPSYSTVILKTGLLSLRQDIPALIMKTVLDGHLWSLCLKIWMPLTA
jgi:hypothetical protein